VRGLKPFPAATQQKAGVSHPTRGAWIETRSKHRIQSSRCRTPPGVRGLKPCQTKLAYTYACRTPPGVRGLKLYLIRPLLCKFLGSHPTRGAWIETTRSLKKMLNYWSHPTRGAWIETSYFFVALLNSAVAPHPGCVD